MELKTFRPVIKYLNQIACFIASWHAVNSAFIVDRPIFHSYDDDN